jgi:hypothetical protein
VNLRSLFATVALALAIAPGTALAAKHSIAGTVVNRNGDPVERVNVTLSPGNVEIITDETGKFLIDYLRDDEGNRTKLSKRTDYTVTFFKVGFHEETQTFFYKRGELVIEPVTLKEDTIKIDPSSDNIDPATYPSRQQDAGGSYEGE